MSIGQRLLSEGIAADLIAEKLFSQKRFWARAQNGLFKLGPAAAAAAECLKSVEQWVPKIDLQFTTRQKHKPEPMFVPSLSLSTSEQFQPFSESLGIRGACAVSDRFWARIESKRVESRGTQQ